MKHSFLLLVLLLAPMAVGQYSTTYSKGFKNLTAWETTTNLWKYMPANPVCSNGSLALSFNSSIYCTGGDGYVYKYDPSSHTWIKQIAMGTNVHQIIIQSDNNVFAALNIPTQCNNFPNGKYSYALGHWTGSTWTQPNTGSCATNYSISADGVLFQTGWDTTNNINALYFSKDSGTTWTWWSDSWSYVNMLHSGAGCALADANSMWMISLNESPVQFPAIPTGTFAGCALGINSMIALAWNTAGNVYELSTDGTDKWNQISGLSVGQVAATTRQTVFALEASTGKPHHWNVLAPIASGATTGTWTGGCPGAPNGQCSSGITHTVNLQVKYHSGHGINYSAGNQHATQAWNSAFNVQSWDANPFCDPIFGDPSDEECPVDGNGNEICNFTDHTLGSAPPFFQSGISTNVISWLYDDHQDGPFLSGSPDFGEWYGDTYSVARGACNTGIPTCAVPNPVLTDTAACGFVDSRGGSICLAIVKYLMNINSIMSPWVIFTPYTSILGGPPICGPSNGLLGSPIPYWGFQALTPECN